MPLVGWLGSPFTANRFAFSARDSRLPANFGHSSFVVTGRSQAVDQMSEISFAVCHGGKQFGRQHEGRHVVAVAHDSGECRKMSHSRPSAASLAAYISWSFVSRARSRASRKAISACFISPLRARRRAILR